MGVVCIDWEEGQTHEERPEQDTGDEHPFRAHLGRYNAAKHLCLQDYGEYHALLYDSAIGKVLAWVSRYP